MVNVIDKLKKLISLRDHPDTSENEVINAAEAITKLLYKYNLDEADITFKEECYITDTEIPYKTSICGGSWYCSLVTVIANNNLCKCLIIKSPSKTGRMLRDKFKLVGRKNNLELVTYMIDSYANKFWLIGRNKYRNSNHEITQNKFLRSFLEGCAAGLNRKYKEMRDTFTESKALILTNNAEIDKYLSNYSISKARKSQSNIDYEAYASGYDTGRNTEINQGLNNGRNLLLNGRR